MKPLEEIKMTLIHTYRAISLSLSPPHFALWKRVRVGVRNEYALKIDSEFYIVIFVLKFSENELVFFTAYYFHL